METANSLPQHKGQPQRLIFLLTGLAAIALVVATLGAMVLTRSTPPEPSTGLGTRLDGRSAPDFRLTDHRGAAYALSGAAGRPVVLTFLYTNCPDFCPLTADKLRETMALLGDQASAVDVVAVSVDPARDDAAAAASFSARHRLTQSSWHYLVGSEAELSEVWRAYGISQANPGLGPTSRDVLHTDAVFIIDGAGRQHRLLRSDFGPADLAAELRTLVKGP